MTIKSLKKEKGINKRLYRDFPNSSFRLVISHKLAKDGCHQAARRRRAAGLSPAQVPPFQSGHLLTKCWRFLRRGVYNKVPSQGIEGGGLQSFLSRFHAACPWRRRRRGRAVSRGLNFSLRNCERLHFSRIKDWLPRRMSQNAQRAFWGVWRGFSNKGFLK